MKGNKVKLGTHRRRLVATLSGIALVSIAASSMAGAAYAAPGDGGTGSITIHKFEQPIEGDLGPADGSELSDTSGASPVEGVEFSVCEIEGIDLTVSSGWDRLSGLSATLDATEEPVLSYTGDGTAPTLGDCTPLPLTDADGVTVATALDADFAYLIYESEPLPQTTTVSQPAILSIPFPGNGEDGQPTWNYNPHIYPKNVLVGSGATKNAEVIGSDVTFDILVPVQNLGIDDIGDPILYGEFKITDVLSGHLDFVGGLTTLESAGGLDVPLVAGGADYTLSVTGQTIEMTFEAPGLEKLDDNVGGMVQMTINARATAPGDTSNTATITINGFDGEVEVETPQELFDGAHILKTAMNVGQTVAVPLGGATFQLYSEVNAAPIATCPATVAAAASLLEQVDTGTTPFVSASVTGSTPTVILAEGDYCVYETVVPAGYRGVTTGTKFTVSGEDANVTIENAQFGSEPGDLPALPITGASGQVLLRLAGSALLALAAGLYLVRYRRQKNTVDAS